MTELVAEGDCIIHLFFGDEWGWWSFIWFYCECAITQPKLSYPCPHSDQVHFSAGIRPFKMLGQVSQSAVVRCSLARQVLHLKRVTSSSGLRHQHVPFSTSIVLFNGSRRKKLIPGREEFASRHIGPREKDRDSMLAYLGFKVCCFAIFAIHFGKSEIKMINQICCVKQCSIWGFISRGEVLYKPLGH